MRQETPEDKAIGDRVEALTVRIHSVLADAKYGEGNAAMAALLAKALAARCHDSGEVFKELHDFILLVLELMPAYRPGPGQAH